MESKRNVKISIFDADNELRDRWTFRIIYLSAEYTLPVSSLHNPVISLGIFSVVWIFHRIANDYEIIQFHIRNVSKSLLRKISDKFFQNWRLCIFYL